MPPKYRKVINQDHVNLTWADNHPHEPEIDGGLHQTRIGNKIVGVNVAKLHINVEANDSHHHTTEAQEKEEKPRLEPPLLIGVYFEHLGNVLAVVINITAKTLILLQRVFLT